MSCDDIKKEFDELILLNEIITALDNLLVLKNNSKCTLCKGFLEVNYNIEKLRLLVEQLDSALSEQNLEKNMISCINNELNIL